MRLTLYFDHRFYRASDGVIYSPASYNYELLSKRYLSVFDEVRIVARVVDTPDQDRAGKHSEGPGIKVFPLGNWQGPVQYMRMQRDVNKKIAQHLKDPSAIMMIAPGRIGQVAASHIRAANRPYGIEVVGDPSDIFSSGTSQHRLRRMLQVWAVRELRLQTGSACAVAYVSRLNLPDRYPARPGAFVTNYSSIELMNEHFVDHIPVESEPGTPLKIVTIGTLSQMYKGIDVLIDALAILHGNGVDAKLEVLGDGRYRQDLEEGAVTRGVADRVTFLGHLPAGEPVRATLDGADLFVLASRTEGLPRSMIEAMARGLPCIGSRVGGIPELLPPEDMVPAGDVDALAKKIRQVVNQPDRLRAMAERNLESARAYRSDILQERRNALYSHVKVATAEWLGSR